MLFALNKNGKRIFIDDTVAYEDYFCPECGEKLVLKKGNIKIHHFAHPSNSVCTDTWHYDMSIWHINWQNRFPKETQEIVKEKDGKIHRADVLLEDKKAVFEFQHSPMTSEEFNDRNAFYNSLGYKVIWIFDVAEQYENETLDNYKSDVYCWQRPKKTFIDYDPKVNKNVELYFEIQNDAIENETIIHGKESLAAGYEFHFKENEIYYRNHLNDRKEIIKVVWVGDGGFKRFASDGFIYKDTDIIQRFIKSTEDNGSTVRLADLSDNLIEMYYKDETSFYFGCPRSSTHLCGNCNLGIPDNKYSETYPCSECEYSSVDDDFNPRCRKRFIDLKISGNTQVKVLERNSDGFITKLAYDDDVKRHIVELPTFINSFSKSIFTLWKENNYNVAIFKNVKSGRFVKISKDPSKQWDKYGKVYGYFSSDQFSFKGDSCEIYGCSRPQWVCVWSK